MAEVKTGPTGRELAWARAVWDVMGDHGGRPWCGGCDEDPDCPACVALLVPDLGPILALSDAERAKAWDEGHKQGGPMRDVNYDDEDALAALREMGVIRG